MSLHLRLEGQGEWWGPSAFGFISSGLLQKGVPRDSLHPSHNNSLQLSFAPHSCPQLWAAHISKTSFEASGSNLGRGRAKEGRVVRRERPIPSNRAHPHRSSGIDDVCVRTFGDMCSTVFHCFFSLLSVSPALSPPYGIFSAIPTGLRISGMRRPVPACSPTPTSYTEPLQRWDLVQARG